MDQGQIQSNCFLNERNSKYNVFMPIYIYIYTTVQKFGVIQTILCLPWKLTFIYLMNWKLNRKYSQDIDKVRNND